MSNLLLSQNASIKSFKVIDVCAADGSEKVFYNNNKRLFLNSFFVNRAFALDKPFKSTAEASPVFPFQHEGTLFFFP